MGAPIGMSMGAGPTSEGAMPSCRLDDGAALLFSTGGAAAAGRYAEAAAHAPPQSFAEQHTSQRMSRQRMPGGAQATTAATLAGMTSKVAAQALDANQAGPPPPFKSENERRAWLLQEKRRWIVEMRLGHAVPDVTEPAKLPPISGSQQQVGHVLMSGAALDTVATPRR